MIININIAKRFYVMDNNQNVLPTAMYISNKCT